MSIEPERRDPTPECAFLLSGSSRFAFPIIVACFARPYPSKRCGHVLDGGNDNIPFSLRIWRTSPSLPDEDYLSAKLEWRGYEVLQLFACFLLLQRALKFSESLFYPVSFPIDFGRPHDGRSSHLSTVSNLELVECFPSDLFVMAMYLPFLWFLEQIGQAGLANEIERKQDMPVI